VNEENGTLEVCVLVFEPNISMPLAAGIDIPALIATRAGTAGIIIIYLLIC
jgi:hypothetical protein